MALGSPSSHVQTYVYTLCEKGTVIRMSGSALELTEVASIFTEDDIIRGSLTSWPGIGELCVALGSHPHMYTPTLWEQGTVIRMPGFALELTEVASIFREDDM